MLKIYIYIHFKKEVNDKDPKFKVGDHVRISNTKTYLLKDTHQIGPKKFLLLKKLTMQSDGHMSLMILMGKKLLEHFMKKSYRGRINKNLGQKK